SDGLRVFKDFTVDDGDRREMTIDLDLRRSLRKPEGSEFAYRLVPSLRIVDDDRSGTITGRVADSRISSDCRPAVYVFAGRDAAADDIDGDGGDPFTSARVLREAGEYVYTAAFLPAGDYSV